MAIDSIKVSMVPNNRDKTTIRNVSVGQLFEAIRSGRWADKVQNVRYMIKLGMPKADISHAKGSLPAMLPSGIFTHASNKGFAGEHSGIICADLDHVDPCEVEDAVGDLDWVAGWFVSPSGDGVKVLCLTDANTEDDHWPAWETVRRSLADCGMVMDKQTKDINRLCYVSHDPLAVLRPCYTCKIDRTIERLPVVQDMSGIDCISSSMRGALDALDRLGHAREGDGGSLATFKACNIGYDYGIKLDDWLCELYRWNEHNAPPWEHEELYAKCASAYRCSKNPFGLLAMFEGVI